MSLGEGRAWLSVKHCDLKGEQACLWGRALVERGGKPGSTGRGQAEHAEIALPLRRESLVSHN
jgi:hypothetical protein